MDKILNRVEAITIALVSAICVIIAVLDFFGALDSINWLKDRVTIMTLLTLGSLGFYILSSYSKNQKRTEQLILSSNAELKKEISSLQNNAMIFDQINQIWKDRENGIRKVFQAVLDFDHRGDQKRLIQFLRKLDREIEIGQIIDRKVRKPWDFDIVAFNMNGDIVYHRHEDQISKRPLKHYPIAEVLSASFGEILWPNNYPGRLSELPGFPFKRNQRLTKIYVREIPQFQWLLTFESHISVLPELLTEEEKKMVIEKGADFLKGQRDFDH